MVVVTVCVAVSVVVVESVVEEVIEPEPVFVPVLLLVTVDDPV